MLKNTYKAEDNITFIDTHAHLTDKAFAGDLENVLKNCREGGIMAVITSGFNLPSSFDALNLAQREEDIFASVGVYPENIYELTAQVENDIFSLAQNQKVVAIGEIGLQYTPNMPDREAQKRGFLHQLDRAKTLKKPVVIHCRDAYGDMTKLLKENKNLLEFGGTMHCFSGSKEIAKELLKLDLHISVGGVSTFKNAQNLRDTLSALPLERMLLETDCPYLAPHPHRGERNTPAFIPTIAQNLALLKGVEVGEVEEITTQNARRLFNI